MWYYFVGGSGRFAGMGKSKLVIGDVIFYDKFKYWINRDRIVYYY